MNTEPSQTDVAAVAAHLDNQPAPAPTSVPTPTHQAAPATPTPEPTPAAQPAEQPTPQAEPTDPFAQFAKPAEQPTEPAKTEPSPQPQQPSEQPTPQPQQPTEPVKAQEEPTYQSYDDYMKSVLKDVSTEHKIPDASKIPDNDPEAIKNFFDELVNTAVSKAKQEVGRSTAIQTSERKLWDAAFDKYGTLKTNKNLRDTVHSIRMGHFQRGIAITPTQAAEKLLDSLGSQYKQGVADSAVVSTIQNVQPTGGQSGVPVSTTLDAQGTLTAVQTGGEQALAEILDKEIKAGNL